MHANIHRLGMRRWPDSCAHAPAQYIMLHLLTLRHGAQLLNVWVEPLVHVNVRLVEGSTAADSAVIIEAVNWSLHGSELIESLGLNRRFSLAFQVGAPRADRVQISTIDTRSCVSSCRCPHCCSMLCRRQARLTWTPADPATGAAPNSGNGSAVTPKPAQGADMTSHPPWLLMGIMCDHHASAALEVFTAIYSR